MDIKRHLILSGSSIKDGLSLLNSLTTDPIIFVIDNGGKLLGALTDGDVRRGLLNGYTIENSVNEIIQPYPKYFIKGENNIKKIIQYRDANLKTVPVVDNDLKVINIINFNSTKSFLEIDVVMMAGGRGIRLRPLTDSVPKPLLKVGNKPIIEYNLDRLSLFGISDFWISVNYLGGQIENYFGSGVNKNINIRYVRENIPLGTIGAVSKIKNFKHEYVLITNSDLLTNIDYEHFYLEFINQDADFAILTMPYNVNVPYAVLNSHNGRVLSLNEKPTYTYLANGGVYLMKRTLSDLIPADKFYNATDFVDDLIRMNYKVISYPFYGYWLDIGSHKDFEKAQEDVKHMVF